MNQDLTLVILAAGMGSRFGGLKQIAPLGPNGEFIIDYSVYDAIKAGFTKIVLPSKNISSSLKVPKGAELLGVSNIYQVLLHMRTKEKDVNFTT